jgi:hypothetical protein
VSVPETLDDLPRRVARWAVNRSLAPASVSGISLALAVCAAGWFSAGTRPDNVNGALALCASYLAACAARWLAGPAPDAPARSAGLAADRMAEWCGAVSEYAVYAGLAVGGYEEHWRDTWELAVAVMIVLSVRRTVVACSRPGTDSPGAGNSFGHAIRVFLSCPPGGRIALITLAAPIWGARATLLFLLEWGIIATGFALTGHGPYRVAGARSPEPVGPAFLADSPVPVDAEQAPGELAAPGRGTDQVEEAPGELAAPGRGIGQVEEAPGELAAPGRGTGQVEEVPGELAAPGRGTGQVEAVPGELAAPISDAGQGEPPLPQADRPELTAALDLFVYAEPAAQAEAAPEAVADPRALAVMAACRDDGTAAVWLGRVVRGELVPLPPAVAGLAATSLLAWLGMRNLPGLLLLTPVVVMLLAAFGSRHPHDGRLDWLTPAVLLAGQLVYFAAVGFSFRVPPPVTFTLCGLVALHYVELAGRGGPDTDQAPDTRLGWEGRMVIAGLGAMIGIAMIAYLALAAYLVVLVCSKILTSRLVAWEGAWR